MARQAGGLILMKLTSRRQLLMLVGRGSLGMGAMALLAACSPGGSGTGPAATSAPPAAAPTQPPKPAAAPTAAPPAGPTSAPAAAATTASVAAAPTTAPAAA